MGFGTLLIGYLFAFLSSISSIYFFGDIIGGCIMMWGLYRLAQYQRKYLYSVIAMFPFLLISLFNAVTIVFSISVVPLLDYSLRIGKILVIAVLHYFMLTATADLSLEADVESLAKKSKRNLIVTYVYAGASVFLNIAALILGDSMTAGVSLASYIISLFGIVWVILNSLLLYSCFGMICLEDDLEYTPKKSKFEFINKINEKIDNMDVSYHPAVQDESRKKRKKKKKK